MILAQTVKGWTLGPGVEARNITHQAKKLTEDELRIFRDRLELPIPDDKLKDAPYYHPGPDSPEVQYLLERRRALGGPLPRRVVRATPLPPPPASDRRRSSTAAARPPVSTTMAFTRLLRNLIRDKGSGRGSCRSSRTRRARSAWTRCSRRSASTPRSASATTRSTRTWCSRYREATDGQVLEEGITEAGSMASFQAAGTAYATHGEPMIPFYIFYSMFGFQRTGDQIWAFGDARGRGFLLGATAGRTTLNGEGLQHDDGHTQVLATTVPNVQVYDPAFAYELAAIVRDGIQRMYVKGEDISTTSRLYNENYVQPARPEGVDEGILRGLYRFAAAPELGRGAHPARLVGSGSILHQVLAARDLLAERFGVAAEVWSAPSFQLLRNDALDVERWNRLHPDASSRGSRTSARSCRPTVARSSPPATG